jgi:hypothetical protein
MDDAWLGDLREKIVTRLLAPATDCRANTTVFVVSGVALALLGASEAGLCTGFDRCGDDAQIGGGLPRHDPAGRIAGIGAVEVESNAADQLGQIALREAGVRARGTARGTVDTLIDAAEESVAVEAAGMRMQVDDLSNSHGLLSSERPGHRSTTGWPCVYASARRLFVDRPLGGWKGFEALVRDWPAAFDRAAVGTGSKTCLGTLDGRERLA